MAPPLRILQLSDPHLLADPHGRLHGRSPHGRLRRGLQGALAALRASGELPHHVLISGDLCHDETWGGYSQLAVLLDSVLPADLATPLLLAGNHDHPQLLRAALGRRARIAPGLWPLDPLADWSLLALDSHCCGLEGGRFEASQWAWLERELRRAGPGALLVALHHPPLPIGDPGFDAIALQDGERLLASLAACPRVRAVVFGHVHQHWQGTLPGRPEVPLLGCPSTLVSYGPVQPCPLGRSADPGGRLLELGAEGEIRHRLLRWSAEDCP